MLKVTVGDYQFILSNEDVKAIQTEFMDIAGFIENAIRNKARQMTDKIILKYSDKQPSKISSAKRAEIVRNAKVKSVGEAWIDSPLNPVNIQKE